MSCGTSARLVDLYSSYVYDIVFFCLVAVSICFLPAICMVITYSKSKDQPRNVANPARDQLNRENEYFPVPVRV